MNTFLRTSVMAALCAGLALGGCKRRDKDVDLSDADSVALAANADDEAASSDGQEMALEDADQLFNNASVSNGRVEALCGASVDTGSVANQRTITFDGTTACGDRGIVRSGSITVRLVRGERWADKGSVLSVTLNDYGRRKRNGRTVTLNGTGTIRNDSGGLRRELGVTRSLVHHTVRFTGTRVNYNGHTFSNWNIAKTRTITRAQGETRVVSNGDTTLSDLSAIGAWGIGRNGELFYTQFVQPVVRSSACEGPLSGNKFHHGFRRSLNVVFGVDANGNTVTSGCPYGFKYDFEGPRRHVTGVVGY